MRLSEKDLRTQDNLKSLNNLDYSDYIALLETSLERAHEQLKTTSENAKKVGLEIEGKSEILNALDL